MKTFVRILTIIIVLTLIPAGSATAQITPAPAPAPTPAPAQTTPGAAIQQQMIKETNKTADDVRQKLIQLNIATSGQSSGGKVLIVPTAQINPQDMVTLMEDITVMSRIFDTKLAQSNLKPTRSFYGVILPGRISIGRDSFESMYIQGYGALFMTTVDFPLSPPPQKEEKEETDEDADPLWEQMKEEIFLPQEATRRAPVQPEEKYDPKKVENLKTTLIESLVHAANIRGLKPNESVILTVTGRAISSNVDQIVAIKGTNQIHVRYKDENVTKMLRSPSLSDLGISSPTVLTIRAKKSYIDALAQKKIDFDEFREKVQILSYPCLGENLIRGSFPSFGSSETTGYSLPSSPTDGLYGGSSGDRGTSGSSGIDEVGQSSSNRRRR